MESPIDLLAPGLPIDGVACRGARAMLGVSQAEVCRRAGIGRSLLNDFENGVRVPRVGSALKVRIALEELGAVFLARAGGLGVCVEPRAAAERTPRAKSLAPDAPVRGRNEA